MEQRRPSLLRLSPIDLFRPRAAGGFVTRASRLSLVASSLLAVILIVAVVVIAAVWAHTFGIVGQDFEEGITWAGDQSFNEAWVYLYGDNLFAGIGLVFLLLPPALGLFVLLSAFTHLIDVHRHGRFISSLGLTIRAASASLWPALGLITICCALGLLLDRYWWDHPEMKQLLGPPPWALVVMPGIPACGLVMASWTRRAIDKATMKTPPIEHAPRCEGCGYDLTHRPADGLCPECGLSIDESLLPMQRRPGSSWERQKVVTAWLKTVAAIVITPKEFYGRLQLRTPFSAAGRFYRSQFVVIGLVAAACAQLTNILIVPDQLKPAEKVFISILVGLWAAFGSWGLQRLLMAWVFLDWIRRHALTDFGCARKVFYYESAYLWVFCLFNGLWASWMFATDGRGLSDLTALWLGHRLYILGLRIDEFAIFLGNGVLCCLWIWRYYIALAAIRWSNF